MDKKARMTLKCIVKELTDCGNFMEGLLPGKEEIVCWLRETTKDCKADYIASLPCFRLSGDDGLVNLWTGKAYLHRSTLIDFKA